MKKVLVTLILLAAFGGGGYAFYKYRNKKPAPSVTTATVTRGDIADRVGATGTLQAVTTVQVGTQVSGTIQQLNADFNSLVKKGQVLARLDPSLFQTQIEQARANLLRSEADVERLRVELDDAKTKLRRATELSGRQLLPKSDLDAAEVAVRSAEAQLRSAEAQVAQAQASLNQNQVNLEHTVIEAPIDGLVISRNVDVGQTVAASMQAPTLYILAADLTKMQVLANLDESDVGRIRPGQSVTFRVDAYPGEEFHGTVAQVRLQPIIQQNVVTYATVIDVPNPELKLKPGMTANVNVEIARRSAVLRIPNTALRFRPSNDMYAAFGQTPPAGGRGDGSGGNGRGRNAGGTGAVPSTPAAAASTAGPMTPNGQPAAGAGARQGAANRERTARTSVTEVTTQGEGGDRRGAGEGGTPDAPGGRPALTAEQLQSLSPEQRARLLEKTMARGSAPAGATPARAGASSTARSGKSAAAAAVGEDAAAPAGGSNQSLSARNPRATTIDALFGPLQTVESVGRVFVFVDGQLKPLRVRLGITDGQMTELLQGNDVDEGTELVTNVTTGNEATRPAATGGFPFMGQQPGRFGGPGGGGNRGGGGGR
jgi:HlyD family secretion protein